MHDPLTYQLLTEFLRAAEVEGYPLGVGRHLQLQQLLARLPESLPPERLRHLLVPLLARSEQEQKQLYELFDQSLERVKAVNEPSPGPLDDREGRRLRWLIPVLGLLLMGLSAYPAWRVWQSLRLEDVGEKTAERELNIPVTAGEIANVCLDSLLERTGLTDLPEPQRCVASTLDTLSGRWRPSGETCLDYTAPDTSGNDPYCLLLEGPRTSMRVRLFMVVQPRPRGIVADTVQTPATFLTSQPLPHPSDITTLSIELPHAWAKVFIDNEWLFKILFILLLGVFLFALLRWRERRRRVLVAEMERKEKPPYVWNIDLGDTGEDIELGENFQLVLNRMRRRVMDEHARLSIPRTIEATVEKAGQVDLRYARQTHPPEYLLLIERQYARSHRARLFDLLYQAFRDNEVYVERFFYRGDIRSCYNESFPEGLAPAELQHYYSNTRLIILGGGEQLVSPVTGRLSEWTEVFSHWRDRALLTPRPVRSWGSNEVQLGRLFHVLPASLQSMAYLVDELDSADEADFSDWRERVADITTDAIVFDGSLLGTLRAHYSEPMIQWIAACALYPTLHWDLTLYLGRLLSTEEAPLLNLFNLMHLSHLPWFAEGNIPREARAMLLAWFEEENPALLLHIRRNLHQVLALNPPPEDSSAFEDYQMNMALNEWLFADNPQRRKELERQIAQLLERGVEPDFTVAKYLNRERSPLDFIVPNAWKPYVHRGGPPGLGQRGLFKDVLYWAFPLWMLLSGFALWFEPPGEGCGGSLVEYAPPAVTEALQLCLDSAADSVLYYEFLARDAVRAAELPAVDSLHQLAEQTRASDSVKVVFRQNVGVALYNAGIPFYQRLMDGASLSLQDSACLFFLKAYQMDSLAYELRLAHNWCREEPPPELDIAPFINGRVLDENGNPIPRVAITGPGADEPTGPEGRFTLTFPEGYPEPRITLGFRRKGFLSRTLSFNIDGILRLPDVRLPASGEDVITLSGVVMGSIDTIPFIDPDTYELRPRVVRAPLPGVYIQSPYGNAVSDEEGRFEIVFSPPQGFSGRLRLKLAKAGYKDTTLAVAVADSALIALSPLEPSSGFSTFPIGRPEPGGDEQGPLPYMVFVKGGSFRMGDVMGDDEYGREQPVHTVQLDGFYISQYEVTFAEYDRYCEMKGIDKPPGALRGQRPVINVSWYDAVQYCNWLSEQFGYKPVYTIRGRQVAADWAANGFRLPTEAEWEYAARERGKNVRFGNGQNIADPREMNIDGRAKEKESYSVTGADRRGAVPVTMLSENALGLKHMSGNVYEWCWDWYAPYSPDRLTNPKGPEVGESRIIRGGSWVSGPIFARAAYRGRDFPRDSGYNIGFRLARRGE